MSGGMRMPADVVALVALVAALPGEYLPVIRGLSAGDRVVNLGPVVLSGIL